MLLENETPNPPLLSQLLITIQCGMSIANPFRVQSLHFREFQAINAMLMGAVMERAYDQPSDITHGDGTSPQSHAPAVPKRLHILPRPKHKLHVGQRVRIANILDYMDKSTKTGIKKMRSGISIGCETTVRGLEQPWRHVLNAYLELDDDDAKHDTMIINTHRARLGLVRKYKYRVFDGEVNNIAHLVVAASTLEPV